MVVLVFVARQDAIDAGPDHLQIGMLGQVGVAGIVQGSSKCLCQPDALVELADGKQSSVAGELAHRRLDHQRCVG
jgi:hypothetical protein